MLPTRLRTFALIWLGQAVSLIGAGLTSFALGVYVYQTTGSVSSFALIELLSLAPAALLSPFARCVHGSLGPAPRADRE